MRHHHLIKTLTLLGTTITGTLLWADTPVKPTQASFNSPFGSTTPGTTTVPMNEKLLPRTPVPEVKIPEVVLEKKVAPIDLNVKAACVEVAWLQDPVTYSLHLRADKKTDEQVIVLSGYVPNDRMREKVIAIAKVAAGPVTLLDHLVVQPQMMMNYDAPIDANLAFNVQDRLEKAAPGVGRTLQIMIDANGITTVTGRVDEFSDRVKLIRALQGIPGCTAIRYDLRVYQPPVMAVTNPVVPLVVARTLPVKPPAPPVVVLPVKPPVLSMESKKTDIVPVTPASTPILLTPPPSFPKLIGSISTVKQPSPTIEEIEQRANQTVNGPAPTVVQVNHVQDVKDVKEVKKIERKSVDTITCSSLSGLFPPVTMARTVEPAVQLGLPVIVRTSYESKNQDGSASVKTAELTKSSTTSSPIIVTIMEPTPIPINFMPRLAK